MGRLRGKPGVSLVLAYAWVGVLVLFMHYLAGVVYGDGAFYYDKHARMYFIYIYDKQYEYLVRLSKLILDEYGKTSTRIRPLKNKNSYELRIGGKNLYENLKELINVLLERPSIHFIAGLADADGTMYYDKHHGVTIEIASVNEKLIRRIGTVMRENGIRAWICKSRGRGNRQTIYKVRIRGKENVSRFIEIIKPLHPKFYKSL